MTLYNDHPLQGLATFGTPAFAHRLAVLEPATSDDPNHLDHEVEQLLTSNLLDEPYLILGGGSNVVFTRDFPGTVIMLGTGGLHVADGEGCTCLTAGAGVKLDDAVDCCVRHGSGGGVENLSAIPGTLGGAVVQNAGAYGVETGDYVDRVEAVDLHERRRVSFAREQCRFAYRTSLFKENPGRYLILEVRLRLPNHFTPVLKYKALADELQSRGIDHPSAQQIRSLVTDIRWSKLPRPEEYGSAGSFFKNPLVTPDTYHRLREAFPDMPQAHASEAGYKLSAAWLIDRAGWKGRTMGHAGVWPKHALVLYNAGGATGNEVVALSSAIQRDVQEKFHVGLTPEAILI